MKKLTLFTLICGMLLISLAAPAAASTSFTNVPALLKIVPDGIKETKSTIILHNDAWNSDQNGRSFGTTTNNADLEAKVIVDSNGDNIFNGADVSTGWGSNGVISQAHFTSTKVDTPVQLIVRGKTDGFVDIDTSDGLTLDMANFKFHRAEVTVDVQIPEFPTVALPVAGILGILFVFGRKKEGL